MDASIREPTPSTNSNTPIVDLVKADLDARSAVGVGKYGTKLQAHNGRYALMDAYQEALDLCMYLRQVIEEDGLMPLGVDKGRMDLSEDNPAAFIGVVEKWDCLGPRDTTTLREMIDVCLSELYAGEEQCP